MTTDIAQKDETALPGLLSVTELATYLGVPDSTLYLWRSRGEGPPAVKIGKRLRYRTADVVAWLESQARPHQESA